MGIFGSSAPVPLDPATASYNPNPFDIGVQMLFGHGSPAEAAETLREMHYANAMRPVQAQAMQGWLRFLSGNGQQAPQPGQGAPQNAPGMNLPAPAPGSVQTTIGGVQGAPGGQPSPAPQPMAASSPGIAGFNIGDPTTQRILAGASAFGMPGAQQVLDIAKSVQPHVTYDRGFGYDDKTGRPMGAFHPDLEKDQIPLYDPSGNFAGVKNADGSVNAAAQMAGATAGAQEAAKAGWDLVDVPLSNGATAKLPRSVAVAILARNGMAPAGGMGAGSPGVSGGDGVGDASGAAMLGVSQTPAQAELAKARAQTQGQREQLQPKEYGALMDLDNTSAQTSQIIHQMLGDVQDPKTGHWVSGGNPQANKWTTGALGHLLSEVPGTPQHDLDQQLEHLRAMTSMEQLQNLRDNSPTGAGLGRVTQQEINLLSSMRGSVDQGQRLPQFQQNMRRQLTMLDQMLANRRQVYDRTYGDVQPATWGSTQPVAPAPRAPAPSSGSAAAPSRAALIAEARRRGLIK